MRAEKLKEQLTKKEKVDHSILTIMSMQGWVIFHNQQNEQV